MISFLDQISDITVHLLGVFSLILFLVSIVSNLIPIPVQYRMGLQIIAAIALVFCSWFESSLFKDQFYKVKELEQRAIVAELEKKVLLSEKNAAEANGRIEVVYRDRVQVVKESQVVLQEKLKQVAIEIDGQCKISKSTVSLLNEAAIGGKN